MRVTAGVDRNNPKRAKSSESRYSRMEFMRAFPDDATCIEWLRRTRYSDDGEHAFCDNCATVRSFKRYATTQRLQSWTCTGCGVHVHPTAGTIFQKSSTSLHLWFYAMYLMTSTRCGISAKQLERELGVTYKTAWRMFHLIRTELMTDEGQTLSCTVEMDETFIGRKPRQSDRNKWEDNGFGTQQAAMQWSAKTKTAVFGMVEPGGNVAAFVVPSIQGPTLNEHIVERVAPSAIVNTNEAQQYVMIMRDGKYAHRRINHKSRAYLMGDIHTQTIEGFWSLVKRGIDGTHHAVSRQYLQGYVNEYVWRYNHCELDGPRCSVCYCSGRRSRSPESPSGSSSAVDSGRLALATRARSRNTASREGTGMVAPRGVCCVASSSASCAMSGTVRAIGGLHA